MYYHLLVLYMSCWQKAQTVQRVQAADGHDSVSTPWPKHSQWQRSQELHSEHSWGWVCLWWGFLLLGGQSAQLATRQDGKQNTYWIEVCKLKTFQSGTPTHHIMICMYWCADIPTCAYAGTCKDHVNAVSMNEPRMYKLIPYMLYIQTGDIVPSSNAALCSYIHTVRRCSSTNMQTGSMAMG